MNKKLSERLRSYGVLTADELLELQILETKLEAMEQATKLEQEVAGEVIREVEEFVAAISKIKGAYALKLGLGDQQKEQGE